MLMIAFFLYTQFLKYPDDSLQKNWQSNDHPAYYFV
jgi:hypothetical protein